MACFKEDYESVPLFFGHEFDEEFYVAHAPSEDIWKKFALSSLPTPPRSPRRESEYHCLNDGTEDLKLNLDSYLETNGVLVNSGKGLPFPESPLVQNLRAKLIHDCMWSHDPGKHDIDKTVAIKDIPGPGPINTTTDCVDPTTVFPYPINDSKDNCNGTDTPSDSEEEIDVVTVEKLQQHHHRKKVSLTRTIRIYPNSTRIKLQHVKRERSESLSVCSSITSSPSLKRSCSLSVSASSSGSCSPILGKRVKRDFESQLSSVAEKLLASSGQCSSRNSSDSEDIGEGGKRTQHNVLERKRRNDLKYCYFILRDSVPDLAKQERTPKVQILLKARDYIVKLESDSRHIQKELHHHTSRHNELRRTLNELVEDSDSEVDDY